MPTPVNFHLEFSITSMTNVCRSNGLSNVSLVQIARRFRGLSSLGYSCETAAVDLIIAGPGAGLPVSSQSGTQHSQRTGRKRTTLKQLWVELSLHARVVPQDPPVLFPKPPGKCQAFQTLQVQSFTIMFHVYIDTVTEVKVKYVDLTRI